MQDRRKKIKTAVISVMTAFLAAFLVFSGCGKKEGVGLEELSVSDGDVSDGAESSDGSPDREDSEGPADAAEGKNDSVSGKKKDPEDTVFVYVCGAVNAPGVYELGKDARVFEAIGLAGGMTGEAAAEAVNQARTVADGEQIYVPTAEEAQTQGAGVEDIITGNADGSGKININTAGKEELMTLTGIGEAKAQSILDYREEHGRFGSIEDLMQIEGIKEGVFNKIKEDITI